jgi:hypothetical protein
MFSMRGKVGPLTFLRLLVGVIMFPPEHIESTNQVSLLETGLKHFNPQAEVVKLLELVR